MRGDIMPLFSLCRHYAMRLFAISSRAAAHVALRVDAAQRQPYAAIIRRLRLIVAALKAAVTTMPITAFAADDAVSH